MSAHIHILPEEISNQIAAGEVVERPASVVKELVENSIDAGAKKILVWIEDGGLKSIRILDDGKGIYPEDVTAAFHRYATSKIREVDDLNRLSSRGFRGEALASIASVSRCKLVSRTLSTDTGHCITMEGMETTKEEETGAPVGTDITVRNLFFNVPARLKYMKKIETEFSRIYDTVSIISLSEPGIHFEVYHQDKKKLFLPGNENLIDRVSDVFGHKTASQMVCLNFETECLKINGLISKPRVSRGQRRMQYFFVNRRNVHSGSLSHALNSACRGIFESKRFPVGVIYLSVSPDCVDVNVHPQKKEVRFLDESQIYRVLFHTVREALSHSDIAPRLETVGIPLEPAPNFTLSPSLPEETKKHQREKLFRKQIDLALKDLAPEEKDKTDLEVPPLFDTSIHLIGQFGLTYILAESDDNELILYDQHTTHERILYEKIMKQFQGKHIERQGLLVPVTLEIGPGDAKALVGYLPYLNEIGFEVEEFGPQTYIVRSVPGFLGRRASDKRILFDILDDIMLAGKNIPEEKMLDSIVNIMACRAAVKAGDRLLPEEMKRLLIDIKTCSMAYTCPHGRPIMVHLHRNEIDKKFHRPART